MNQPKPQATEPSVPRHLAIIMDGNGRWAVSRGLPRIEGHRRGADTVRMVIEACRDYKIRYLTLYCFSNENWKRPQEELDFLMGLLKEYLIEQRQELIEQGVRLMIIGRRDRLPEDVIDEMNRSIEASAGGDQLVLCLAINYGSRQEIVDAVRSIAQQASAGELEPDEIDESTISGHLYTRSIPDPDMLMRTSGELRISNFLLWQISYSEIWVSPKAWPEFERSDFDEAIQDYSRRQRRFGGL